MSGLPECIICGKEVRDDTYFQVPYPLLPETTAEVITAEKYASQQVLDYAVCYSHHACLCEALERGDIKTINGAGPEDHDHKSLADCQQQFGDIDHLPLHQFPGLQERLDTKTSKVGEVTVRVGLTDRGQKELEALKEEFIKKASEILEREIKVGPLEGP